MPQDTTQPQGPQLDPGFDYAKLPDGSYAKFKKGTSEAEMRGRLIAAGKLPPTPVTPQQAKPKPAPAEPKAGLGKRFAQTMMIPTSIEEAKSAAQGMSGAGYLYQTGKGIYEGAKDIKKGNYLQGAQEVSSALMPFPTMLGTNIGTDVRQKNVRGLVGTGLGLATQATLIHGVPGFADSEALRQRAAKLDTKVLRTAEGGAKNYSLATALQVAKEGIYGTLKSLPDKIEAHRVAKNAQVQSLARQLDAQGTTIDISNEINPITRDVMSVANQRGLLTPQLRSQIMGLLKRVTTETDMQTGAQKPRNLSQMKISDALALQKGLEDLSAFGKEAPAAINNLARRLRGAIGDKLNGASPEMQSLRSAESKLITARDAARDNYAKSLNDGRVGARGFIYSNLPTAAVYVGLKGLGMPFAGAIGSALVLRTLAESTPSRTFRAAMYARAAELLDGAITRNAGPTAPLQPSSPTGGPQLPQGGQPLVNKGVTGQNGPHGPINMGTASAEVVTPPMLERGTLQLPQKASRASAGSGDYVKGPKPEPPGSYLKEKARAEASAKAPSRNVAESNTKNKAMLDRLDTLYERQAKPKSGADRNAIEREIAEIKRVLSGEAKGTDASAINKRIADRERLAAKRAEAKSATPGAQTAAQAGTTAEPAAQGMSPEQRSLLLDAGYKKLATYDGGPEMVKAMRKLAKDMSKVDPSYDEVTALTDALNALREVSGQ